MLRTLEGFTLFFLDGESAVKSSIVEKNCSLGLIWYVEFGVHEFICVDDNENEDDENEDEDDESFEICEEDGDAAKNWVYSSSWEVSTTGRNTSRNRCCSIKSRVDISFAVAMYGVPSKVMYPYYDFTYNNLDQGIYIVAKCVCFVCEYLDWGEEERMELKMEDCTRNSCAYVNLISTCTQ